MDNGLAVVLTPEELKRLRTLPGESGLLFPYRNRGTERRTFTIFTSVRFSDGRRGYLFKGYNVETLYAEYALSFYNNTGFSYVIASDAILPCVRCIPAATKPFPICLKSSVREE